MIEEMERTGVVGPLESNGNREVLAPPPPGGLRGHGDSAEKR